MSTFNGIGTRFLGFSKTEAGDAYYATNWFTFLFFPVIPLYRAKVILKKTEQDWSVLKKKYDILSKEKLSAKEIFSTYLFGWILIPLFIVWPVIFCITEVADVIGLPPSEFKGLINGPNFGVREYLFFAALIWIVVVAWKLKKWDDKRGTYNF